MKTINKTNPQKYADLHNKAAMVTAGKIKVINQESRFITKEGSPIYYGPLSVDTTHLLAVLQRMKGWSLKRQGKLKQRSKYINSSPRTRNKNDYCTHSQFMRDNPSDQAWLDAYARELASVYQREFPERYSKHFSEVINEPNGVLPEYVIENTPFTSGIVNKNSSLAYHLDRKNWPGALSAMITLRKNVSGGLLVLPEYELAFDMRDNYMLLFEGSKIVHGVTQIDLMGSNSNSYRYSVVFYTLEDMADCLTLREELDRINVIK